MTLPAGHDLLMDNVYRYQRHIYDFTRKYYLLGRDRMICGLDVPPGGHVLEIGCGTGRNLIKAMNQFPNASFYGIDISREMLETAARSIERARMRDRIAVSHADAVDFDPLHLFGCDKFDRIFISYAVSMIPQWQQVMLEAASHLAPGGQLHVVDFGDQAGLPQWFGRGLRQWLASFHVTPRDELFGTARRIAANEGCAVQEQRLYRSYTWISIIRRPA
ncbi:MAG: class I SAM-dependent methyltransferase [Phyllobacterium sp.]